MVFLVDICHQLPHMCCGCIIVQKQARAARRNMGDRQEALRLGRRGEGGGKEDASGNWKNRAPGGGWGGQACSGKREGGRRGRTKDNMAKVDHGCRRLQTLELQEVRGVKAKRGLGWRLREKEREREPPSIRCRI